jgi:hypothetical protein
MNENQSRARQRYTYIEADAQLMPNNGVANTILKRAVSTLQYRLYLTSCSRCYRA